MMVKVLFSGRHESRGLLMQLYRVSLVPLSSTEKTPVVKHVLTAGIQGPVISLAWVPRLSGDFHKAVIER